MKVSVITVCKNAQDTIEKTIKSVIDQDYKDVEYILIDGKSTDKTLDIVNKYKNKISIVISEPDNGIFEAMNKGIKLSTGEIINFLNAGDLFYKRSTVSKVVRLFKKHNPDIVYGDAIFYDSNNPHNNVFKSYKYIDRIFLARWSICHQVIFSKKNIFKKYGEFDERYKVAADYNWLLYLFVKKKASFLYINQVIVKYLIGGISWSGNRVRFYYERIGVAIKYYNVFGFLINNSIMRIRSKKLYFHPL